MPSNAPVPPPPPNAGRTALADGRERRTVRALELFGGERELLIEHAGALYRLRITRHGKLILTK